MFGASSSISRLFSSESMERFGSSFSRSCYTERDLAHIFLDNENEQKEDGPLINYDNSNNFNQYSSIDCLGSTFLYNENEIQAEDAQQIIALNFQEENQNIQNQEILESEMISDKQEGVSQMERTSSDSNNSSDNHRSKPRIRPSLDQHRQSLFKNIYKNIGIGIKQHAKKFISSGQGIAHIEKSQEIEFINYLNQNLQLVNKKDYVKMLSIEGSDSDIINSFKELATIISKNFLDVCAVEYINVDSRIKEHNKAHFLQCLSKLRCCLNSAYQMSNFAPPRDKQNKI